MKKELRQLLCPDVNCSYGAPMGRSNFGLLSSGSAVGHMRDVRIPVNQAGYDAGGAYWGVGTELRCRFVVDTFGCLAMREFYRKGGDV